MQSSFVKKYKLYCGLAWSYVHDVEEDRKLICILFVLLSFKVCAFVVIKAKYIHNKVQSYTPVLSDSLARKNYQILHYTNEISQQTVTAQYHRVNLNNTAVTWLWRHSNSLVQETLKLFKLDFIQTHQFYFNSNVEKGGRKVTRAFPHVRNYVLLDRSGRSRSCMYGR